MNWRKFKEVTPLHSALLYLMIGGLWILFSDRLLELLIQDIRTLRILFTLKGWVFITFTAFLFYSLMRYALASQAQEKKMAMAARENAMRYREMFEHMSNAVAVYTVIGSGEDFILKEWNPAAERLENIPLNRILGKSIRTIFKEAESTGFLQALQRVSQTGRSEQSTFYYKSDQNERWRESFIYRLPSGDLVAIFEDITHRKQAEERIRYHAHYDSLTALPNRLLFYEHLSLALAQAKEEQRKCAVMFLDLDQFKRINDTMGHNSGDLLLQAAGERIREGLRQGDIIGRQGGDEFLILLPHLDLDEEAALVAERIITLFNRPFPLDGCEVFVTPSIGISLYPAHGENKESLITHADTAMYYAKEQGRNNYQFYTPELNKKVQERLSLENGLRKGLEREEFLFYYQPQVNLSSGQISGVEVLIRWEAPERGLVSPEVFIPVAEETGLIVPLGERILRNACLQNLEWQCKGYPPLRISVNISARQFRQPNFVETITQILDEVGMEGKWLELEITESVAMEGSDNLVNQLQRLKTLGIRVAIDDFGTGYSSLNSLRQLPFDTLKIDQSFIREIGKDRNGEAVLRSILQLAKDLQLKVVAEGVETIHQKIFLLNQKCDEVQGYFFSPPLPPEEVEKFLSVTNMIKNDLGNVGNNPVGIG